jgi:N-acyl-L-homoserine lactone synthetase
MIHVVTADNREIYREQIAEMHSLRLKHFVEERGWSGLTIRDGGEYDVYDDERTIYFFALDEDGRIGVSMRARPTDDRSMLADAFPHLIGPGTEPIDQPGVWEISRIFATRKFRTRRGVQRRSELFLATVETAVRGGVHRLVGMTDVFLLPQTLAAGWTVKVLGLPASYGEGDVIGVEMDSSPAGLAAFQDRLAVHSPCALHIPASHPFAQLRPEEAESLISLQKSQGPQGLRLMREVVERVLAAQREHSDREIEAMVEQIAAAAGGSAPSTH